MNDGQSLDGQSLNGHDAPAAPRIALKERNGHPREAKKAEAAWHLLMESVKDFAIILLDTDGRFASWNEGAERLLGYESDEILGRPFETIFVPEDIRRGLPARELAKARAEGRAVDDNWLARKDGSRLWASGVIAPLREPDGRFVGYAKLLRDLTETKRYQEEIERLNTSLEARIVERTLQLEAFAYTVAHDLRAPLRAMSGFSTFLVDEYTHCLDERGRDYAQRIMDAAARMDTLIQDLLEYSRLSGAEHAIGPVDLDALASCLVEEMSLQFAEAHAEVAIAAPLGRAIGNAMTLKQALFHLLSNAIKFVPAGVRPKVRVRSEPRPTCVRVWIEDNGIGVDAEHHARIFGVFERLHPETYRGTGIGLAIVRKGIERLGGRVGVESALGQGSRFWFELPGVEGE